MSDQGEQDNTGMSARRRLLLGATSVLGGVSVVASATPFIAGLRPSRKAKAEGAPVNISLKDISEGNLRIDFWRKKLVWVLRRDGEMLKNIHAATKDGKLSDSESQNSKQPAYCENETRSIKEDFFVAVGLCTHLGCSPRQDQNNGFFCACHGSRFDFAGRVFTGSPAPTNLVIPPHHYQDDSTIVIGEDPKA